MPIARSFAIKVRKTWGNSFRRVGIRKIELSLAGQRLEIPGYPFGGIQGAGADSFANAVELVGGMGVAETDLAGYTLEQDEPDHGGFFGGQSYTSAWYKWTAPFTGLAHFDNRNSENEHPIIAVYTGNSLTGLNPVAVNDGHSFLAVPGDWAYVGFDAVQGQEYKIAVCGEPDAWGGSRVTRLNWAVINAYTSSSFGNGFWPWWAFLPYGSKTGSVFTDNSWRSDSICNADGTISGKDYTQLVLVLPQDVEFDGIAINNQHYFGTATDEGIREAAFYTVPTEVSANDAIDDSTPIPGEELIYDTNISAEDIPQHVGNDVIDEYLIDLSEPPANALTVGIGLGALFKSLPNTFDVGIGLGVDLSGAYDFQGAALDVGIGIGSELAGNQKFPTVMKCGLALSAKMTGGATHSPAELLAGIGLGFKAIGDSPQAAKLRAKICLSCLLRADNIPVAVLKAAFAIGAKISAKIEPRASLSAGIGVGVKSKGTSIKPPCLAQEFQHMKWY